MLRALGIQQRGTPSWFEQAPRSCTQLLARSLQISSRKQKPKGSCRARIHGFSCCSACRISAETCGWTHLQVPQIHHWGQAHHAHHWRRRGAFKHLLAPGVGGWRVAVRVGCTQLLQGCAGHAHKSPAARCCKPSACASAVRPCGRWGQRAWQRHRQAWSKISSGHTACMGSHGSLPCALRMLNKRMVSGRHCFIPEGQQNTRSGSQQI